MKIKFYVYFTPDMFVDIVKADTAKIIIFRYESEGEYRSYEMKFNWKRIKKWIL
jgi:hypothetical protein